MEFISKGIEYQHSFQLDPIGRVHILESNSIIRRIEFDDTVEFKYQDIPIKETQAIINCEIELKKFIRNPNHIFRFLYNVELTDLQLEVYNCLMKINDMMTLKELVSCLGDQDYTLGTVRKVLLECPINFIVPTWKIVDLDDKYLNNVRKLCY